MADAKERSGGYQRPTTEREEDDVLGVVPTV